MDKKTVLVVFGGCSPEYDVSLQSAYAVITSISLEKYTVVPLGITRSGKWYRYTGLPERLLDDTWAADRDLCLPTVLSPNRPAHHLLELDGAAIKVTPIDIVFPVLHGQNGEDGTLQGLCALAGIPFVGCGTLSSALCMDKEKAHRLISGIGIRVPRSVCFEGMPEEDALSKAVESLGFPLFVKPVRAGSSFGVTKVRDMDMLAAAVRHALSYDSAVLLEESIGGFEVGCAVLGNETLVTGRADEIELAGDVFDYEEKYTLKTARIHMPARVSPAAEARLRNTAEHIYRALGCRGFARVDMFLTDAEEIVFSEVNTIPGFTAHSRFPKMMQGAGIAFAELVDRLIRLGLDT